ncbi:MAG: conjugal transfer protein TrbC [bacterium]|nr:conjugal transfer protein TrbC [bacterium]
MKISSRALSLACLVLLLFPGTAFASTGGPAMPWDTGLQNLVDNLTGTVARLMIIAAIVVAGITWAFTEHGTGGRKLSQIVFGGGVALAAVSFLANLGFTGAMV